MTYTLIWVDWNAFNIMWYVRKAMRKEWFSQEARENYTDEATNWDYQHLLAVSIQMIDTLNWED